MISVFGSIRALVVKDEKIILVKEDKEWVWETPGGRLEKGDKDPIEACKREVLEETGYECEVLGPLDVVFHKTTKNLPEKFKGLYDGIEVDKVIHVIFKVNLTKKIKEPEKEIIGVKWFSKDEIKKLLDENKADDHDINVFKMFVNGDFD